MEIEEIKEKIFTKRMLKKGFVERELKEMVDNENFYKPETIWFTKEQLEAEIPRIIKIIKRDALEQQNEKVGEKQ